MDIWVLALAAFLVTVVLVLWRPGGIHEAIPALIGAFIMFLVGLVDRTDVLQVMEVVWNSAMTIISTFVMASVLQGAGFFRWVGDRLIDRAKGSGRRLFHLVLAFSACLTLFLNNDGSILLGTPIVLTLVARLGLSRKAAFGYLIGACLIASATSPAIGVSNMANLEAMSLVGISLTEHFHALMIPSLIGLAACWSILYLLLHASLPADINQSPPLGVAPSPPPRHPHAARRHHPPRPPHLPGPRPHPVPSSSEGKEKQPDFPFMWFAVGVVVTVRAGFFVASLVGIPPYTVAAAGACVLLLSNVFRKAMDTHTAVKRAPWAILGFAFGMDLVVFGLRNAGLIGLLAQYLEPAVRTGALGASFLPGTVVTAVSSLMNNHPGLIIGSVTLLEFDSLAQPVFYTAYASIVLGSDLGALLTPVGTLASLIWFHLLRQNGRRYTWWDYLKITGTVIPISYVLALCGLYATTFLAFWSTTGTSP